MSVSLNAIDLMGAADNKESYGSDANVANGTWLAVTSLAAAYGEPVEIWNGHHDPVRYTPEQLRRIADRIDQIKHLPEQLRWLADNGGAELS